MVIKETKVCRQCGKEYPTKEFVTNWRNGTTTYTCCKACRQENYQQNYDGSKINTDDMPWYNWWPLKNTLKPNNND